MLKLFLKDNESGDIHEYGTDKHDALIVNDDGSIHYTNMQNCSGTKCPEEGYSFCDADGNVPDTESEESYLDIGGAYYNSEPKKESVPVSVLFDELTEAEKQQAKLCGILAANVINKRTAMNLSQKGFADKFGIAEDVLSKIESAEYDMKLSEFIELLNKLDFNSKISINGIVL